MAEFKLLFLKRNYSQLAQQGSKAWLTGRRTRFGGSEIGKIMEGKEKSIIDSKRNKLWNHGNLYCWWGNIFERAAKIYLEHYKKIKIEEFGSVPSSFLPVAYSPDGLYIDKEKDELMLLEIKCPFMRNVTKDLEISDIYMKQIQTGMLILPCENTLFATFKFRRCWKAQIGKTGKYMRWFHKEFVKRSPTTDEAWFGALYWNTNNGIIEKFELKQPQKIYVSFKDDVLGEIDKYNSGSFVFFKCFFVNEQIVPRDEKFQNECTKRIWDSYKKLIDDVREHEPEIL